MVSRQVLLRSLRQLHRLREQDPVEEGYRGWNWDRPPLRPRAYLGLGVSEVACRYCATGRDVYLRRLGIEGERTQPLIDGSLVHAVFHAASSDVRRGLMEGTRGWEVFERLAARARERVEGLGAREERLSWLVDLYKLLAITWCAEESAWLFTEYRVDGTVLGLARNLRVDGLAEGGVVVEVKHGKPQHFHRLALAGYALVLEANLEVPFDYGVLIYVVNSNGVNLSCEPVYLSTALRAEFLERRDELIDVLLSGREPPKAADCPESCPFRGAC